MSWGSQAGDGESGALDSLETAGSRIPAAPRSSDPDASNVPTLWTARPIAAAVIRILAFLAPFVLAILAAWGMSRALPTATSWEWAIARIVAIVMATIAVVILVKRSAHRLGSLSALLRLSAAFPDEAPNRFKLAMQMPSARHLERVLNGEQPAGRSLASVDGATAGHIVALMSAVSAHHPRTRGHSERVRAYADLIGEELELDAADRERLRWAALLHDVGKLNVPVEILDKSDRPDINEWAVLEQHPAGSATLTGPLRSWLGPWWGGIGEHHERWDGTGYPNRLRGNEISLAGRIVAVADSFETMTEVRSYKQPMTFEAAQQELVDSAGTHFDPAVVRAFLGISTSRVRRAAGWAAWLPGPLVEAVRAVTATSIVGPAGVATTAAVSLIVPGLSGDFVEGPASSPQVAAAAEVDEHTTTTVERTIAPASTIVVDVPPELAESTGTSEPATGSGGASGETAASTVPTSTSATTSSTAPSTTVAVTTTSVASAVPVPQPPTSPPAPGTTVVSPTTAPAVTTTPPTAPATPPTTSTSAPPTSPPAAVPPTTSPATTTTAVTPPPRFLDAPTFNSSGRTIFASGIDVEGWGLLAMCRLWLPDVSGFVETDIPCSNLMSVLAPESNTAYRVRLQARTSAGETAVVEATVTTGA